jgi:hypothetical protein
MDKDRVEGAPSRKPWAKLPAIRKPKPKARLKRQPARSRTPLEA